jgi:hypothetical protein
MEIDMPNWCSVSFDVYGTAEDLTRFREFVAGKDHEHPTAFDFNKLIPMPTELRDGTDDHGTAYTIYYGDAQPMLELLWVKEANITTLEQLKDDLESKYPDLRATADRWKANMEKYGVGGWFDWSCEYWGAKWNASDAEIWNNPEGSLHVQFDTAWSLPFPVMEKLVAEFPMLIFEGSAVEPRFGSYLGFDGRDGKFTVEDISDEYLAEDENEDESSDTSVIEAI